MDSRCFFDVQLLMARYGLEVRGLSWFHGSQDDYVRSALMQLGKREAEVCRDVPEYRPGCRPLPVQSRADESASGAGASTPSVIGAFGLVAFILIASPAA